MTIERAAKLYMVPDLCLYTKDGQMLLTVTDRKNDTSNSFEIAVGEDTREYCYCFKVENLKVISQAQRSATSVNYVVNISEKKVAHFKGQNLDVEYFIALEPDNE